MILVRSPLRISFVGGGSDLPAFCDHAVGAVVSATMTASVYVSVAWRDRPGIRVSYTKTENVASIGEIEHELVRETLNWFDSPTLRSGLEIVSMADISAQAGLGSSGSFTVGLLVALLALQGRFATASQLTSYASQIEMQLCHRPIGFQDQAAASFGGINLYEFDSRGVRSVESLDRDGTGGLQSRLLLVDLGLRGPSSVLLQKQTERLASPSSQTTADVQSMANLAHAFRDHLLDGHLDECGTIMDAAWSLKKGIDPDMAPPEIDDLYGYVRAHYALGGKLCGAGGRGMLLLFAAKDKRSELRSAILRAFPHAIVLFPVCSPSGARVVYSS